MSVDSRHGEECMFLGNWETISKKTTTSSLYGMTAKYIFGGSPLLTIFTVLEFVLYYFYDPKLSDFLSHFFSKIIFFHRAANHQISKSCTSQTFNGIEGAPAGWRRGPPPRGTAEGRRGSAAASSRPVSWSPALRPAKRVLRDVLLKTP